MVNLLQLDPRIDHQLLHRRRVRDGGGRVGVQRLDRHPNAAVRDSRVDEGPGVVEPEQSGLDADPARQQVLAQLQDPRLALVGRHQLRQLRPAGHELEPPLRVGLDVRRGAQGDWNPRAGGVNGPKRRGARLRRQRLGPIVAGVKVQHPGAGIHRRAAFGGQLVRSPRDSRVLGVSTAPV